MQPIYSDFYVVKNENFSGTFLIFLFIFAQAVFTSTHNLCFGAKIRKIGIPQQTAVLLYIRT